MRPQNQQALKLEAEYNNPGITKRIGWHSFRRTLATLLQSSGASVKTTQELLRHASPGITMGICAKAVTADKRQARDTIAALFVGNSRQI
jgi:integrase